MTTPTTIASARPPTSLQVVEGGWQGSLRAMASTVNVLLTPDTLDPQAALEIVDEVFADTEVQCTRFHDGSDLMLANAAAEQFYSVGSYCWDALGEAAHAHRETDGLFDPRVLADLRRLGYGAALPFSAGAVELPAAEAVPSARRPRWEPEFDLAGQRVRIGPCPVDLGGIGKGLAVRWAAQRLPADSFLIDAGGDCYARGTSASGEPWHIGVEDPRGGERPVAVVAVEDAACTTSSIRIRNWRAGGRQVHHLIDPRTGEPGGSGLLAVTVIASDPAEAEVWSKVFFLHGAAGIGEAVEARDGAALWIGEDGSVGMSAAMRPLVLWQDAA